MSDSSPLSVSYLARRVGNSIVIRLPAACEGNRYYQVALEGGVIACIPEEVSEE